jgi:Cu/Ag efflux pump CusA
MAERLVEAALRARLLVAILTLLVVAVGIVAFRRVP